MKITNKLKLIFFAVISCFCLGAISLSPVSADDVCNTNAPQAVKNAAGCSGNSNALPNTITNIINGIILVLGIVAVVFVVVGGIQYMTSAGDPGKTKKAKDTILYAIIGLIICVLSYAIVNFVILNIIK